MSALIAQGQRCTDEQLLSRLRQLSLVEVDSLLAGTSGAAREQLLATFAGDLQEALGQARARIGELAAAFTSGPDPLLLVSAESALRAREGASQAAGRAAERLRQRAEAGRALARLGDAAAQLLPHLFEADRRLAGG